MAVTTRLDKKKLPVENIPTEKTLQQPTEPISTVVNEQPSKPQTITPTETPKIEPITVEAPKVDTIQATPQVTTRFGSNEPIRPVGVNAPIQEKTTTTTPEGTTTVVKETPKDTTITKDTQWYTTDKSMNSLEQMVEARYGTIATQKDGKLQAQIGDKMYEWNINPQTGMPEKKEVQMSSADLMKNRLLNKYITADADMLYNAMKNGDISPEMELGLTANPNFAIAKEKKRKEQSVNNTNSQIGGMYNTMTGKTEEEKDIVQEMSDKAMANKTGKTEEDLLDYSNFIGQDEELKTSVTELNGKVQQKREIERAIKDRVDELTQQYPGMTKGALMVLAARQNKDLYNQLDFINDDIGNLQSTVLYREKILDREYEAKLSEKRLQDQRAYEQGLRMDERAYQEGLQTRQLEQEYAYQYGDLNSTNPTLQNIAIERAVADMYNKYPLPGMESQAMKVQKVRDFMAQGMTGSQAIAEVENQIRGTQRYKDYISPKETGTQDWAKLDDGTLYNQRTGETKRITGDSAIPEGVTSTPTGTYGELIYTRDNGQIKNVRVDNVALNPLQQAFSELGGGIIVADSMRSPERQAQLYKELSAKGATVAKPGTSKHETGMAIDLYSDNNLNPLKPEQVAIMNKNGWYQTAGEDDLGHFEFLGKQETVPTGDLANLGQFLKDNQNRGAGYSAEDVKAFDEKINRYIKNGDEKGMAMAFRQNLMQDKDFKQEFDNTKKFISGLDGVQRLLNDYEKAGKSTNALKAMAEKVARNLGVTTDTALAQLQTQMGFTLANYIKSISGTAASDAEVQRLMGNMANIKNVKELNDTIVSQVKNNGVNGLKSMIDTRMYGMPEELKPKVFSDIYSEEKKEKAPILDRIQQIRASKK